MLVKVDFNIDNHQGYGHGGGDYAIMHELVRYLNGKNKSVSITDLDDSIYSHLVVYAAEESRKKETTVRLS